MKHGLIATHGAVHNLYFLPASECLQWYLSSSKFVPPKGWQLQLFWKRVVINGFTTENVTGIRSPSWTLSSSSGGKTVLKPSWSVFSCNHLVQVWVDGNRFVFLAAGACHSTQVHILVWILTLCIMPSWSERSFNIIRLPRTITVHYSIYWLMNLLGAGFFHTIHVYGYVSTTL